MRKANLARHVLIAAACGIGLALGLAVPARSLTPAEAEKVSILLAGLGAELGPFAYDEEEAGRIFDEDELQQGRITAAGLDRESWIRVFDEMFRGYLATIPGDIFSARLSEAMEGIEALSYLTEEQKAEVRPLIEEKIAEIRLLRAEGAVYADMVRPHAAILEAAFETGLAQPE